MPTLYPERWQRSTLTDDNKAYTLVDANPVPRQMATIYPGRWHHPYILIDDNTIPWHTTTKLISWQITTIYPREIMTNHIPWQMTANPILWQMRALYHERWQPYTLKGDSQPQITDRWQPTLHATKWHPYSGIDDNHIPWQMTILHLERWQSTLYPDRWQPTLYSERWKLYTLTDCKPIPW